MCTCVCVCACVCVYIYMCVCVCVGGDPKDDTNMSDMTLARELAALEAKRRVFAAQMKADILKSASISPPAGWVVFMLCL